MNTDLHCTRCSRFVPPHKDGCACGASREEILEELRERYPYLRRTTDSGEEA